MKVLPDLLYVAGVGCIGYGAALWSVPLALVTIGGILISTAFLLAYLAHR